MGDMWPAKQLVLALDRPLNTFPGESSSQYVAFACINALKPTMGRAWQHNNLIHVNFNGNRLGKQDWTRIELLEELPESERDFDYEWKDFKEATKFGDKIWFPVHQRNIAPAVHRVGIFEILGELNLISERASYGINDQELVLPHELLQHSKILCRKFKDTGCDVTRGLCFSSIQQMAGYLKAKNKCKCWCKEYVYTTKNNLIKHIEKEHKDAISDATIALKFDKGVILMGTKNKRLEAIFDIEFGEEGDKMFVSKFGDPQQWMEIQRIINPKADLNKNLQVMKQKYDDSKFRYSLSFMVAGKTQGKFHLHLFDGNDGETEVAILGPYSTLPTDSSGTSKNRSTAEMEGMKYLLNIFKDIDAKHVSIFEINQNGQFEWEEYDVNLLIYKVKKTLKKLD